MLGDSKSQRASKSLNWFKSYVDFGERGILPSGGVASGRVCACSLRSWVVYQTNRMSYFQDSFFFYFLLNILGAMHTLKL